MVFYLVRHGETPLSGTYCGSKNPPLSARGRAQARSAARALAHIPMDICYVSPQLRAQQTAALIQRRVSIPTRTYPALREFHFGVWEGLSFKDIALKWPDDSRRFALDPSQVRIPKAETFASMRRRARRFLSMVNKKFSDKHVLVVAHGGLLSALILEYWGRPDRQFSKYIAPLASVRKLEGRSLKWVHRC